MNNKSEGDHNKNIKIEHVITVWSKIIDVQMHFNDIELRIRNIAITAFTFIIGGIGYVEKEGLMFMIKTWTIPYSTVVSLFGILIMLAFLYMDKWWYHKLLLGAVKQAQFIEDKWENDFKEIKLSTSIGNESPHNLFWTKWEVHSKDKYWIFYGLLLIPIFLLGVTIFCLRNF
jgi:hypothetical protein